MSNLGLLWNSKLSYHLLVAADVLSALAPCQTRWHSRRLDRLKRSLFTLLSLSEVFALRSALVPAR